MANTSISAWLGATPSTAGSRLVVLLITIATATSSIAITYPRDRSRAAETISCVYGLGHIRGADLAQYIEAVKSAGDKGVLDGRGVVIPADHLKDVLEPFTDDGVTRLPEVIFDSASFGDEAAI